MRDRSDSGDPCLAPQGRAPNRPAARRRRFLAVALAALATLSNAPLAAAGDAPAAAPPVAPTSSHASARPAAPASSAGSEAVFGPKGDPPFPRVAARVLASPPVPGLVAALASDRAAGGLLASMAPAGSSTAAGASASPAPAGATTTPAAAGSSAPASAPASAQKAAASQGVIVIAIGDDAAPAARALARELYGDEALRPRIDDVTARVLAGEAPKAGAAAKLTEIAELRKAAHEAQTDAVTRRLFASLGADLGAALVVPVAIRDGRPTARVLSVERGAFEPVVLSGTTELDAATGASRVTWVGIAPVLTSLLPKTARPTSPAPGTRSAANGAAPVVGASGAPAADGKPGPLAPKKEEPARSFWTSPWTWVGVGAVVVAGVVVFAASQAQGDAGSLRLQGRVAP